MQTLEADTQCHRQSSGFTALDHLLHLTPANWKPALHR